MCEIMIKGVRLADCTTDALQTEWEAGMFLDAQEGLTDTQLVRMKAVEQELFGRRDADEQSAPTSREK